MTELPIITAPGSPPAPPRRPRLPEWFRVNLPAGDQQHTYSDTRQAVAENSLHTVCEEARCPNLHDCWSRGTATFMVAGKHCTRGCRFCSVETLKSPPPPDASEPGQLAAAVLRMGLRHVVITVVNRDDLPDGGAAHYRSCVEEVARQDPQVTIELLTSDLAGSETSLSELLVATPLAVLAHNVECVERLDETVRDRRASFSQSLAVLKSAKRIRPDLFTKSSLMVGMGETDEEVTDALRRLRDVDVDIVTLGQYLPPGARFLPVDRYVHPDQFAEWGNQARRMGFAAVASGPLVRSSFQAGRLLHEARRRETGSR